MDYEKKALQYAEQHGIIEYAVNGHIMEFMTFYGSEDAWVYIVVDLETDAEIIREKAFPWMGWIPYWLKSENGGCRYNYGE